MLAEWQERIAQAEAEIDRLLPCILTLREMLQRDQRLLEAPHCFSVSRAHGRLDAGLAAVHQGLLPYLSAQGMMRELLDLGGQAVGIERLDDVHDAGVERAPPFLEQAPIGHLLRESMLEGVSELRKEARL